MERRLCLVTGASAGIGRALALEYARHGWNLALTARREERLHEVAAEVAEVGGGEAHVIPADLADPEAPTAVLEAVAHAGRTIDGLVNNAGYGLTGKYASTTWEDQSRFLQVLLVAPSALAHRVLPGMAERGFGRIINVASLAGLTPGVSGHTLYGPAKSYMVRLSEALRAESKDASVHVTALCPGFTYSEFHDVNKMRATVSKAIPKSAWQTSEQVAAIGYRACEANAAIRVCGTRNKIAAGLIKALPDAWARALVASQSAKFRDAS